MGGGKRGVSENLKNHSRNLISADICGCCSALCDPGRDRVHHIRPRYGWSCKHAHLHQPARPVRLWWQWVGFCVCADAPFFGSVCILWSRGCGLRVLKILISQHSSVSMRRFCVLQWGLKLEDTGKNRTVLRWFIDVMLGLGNALRRAVTQAKITWVIVESARYVALTFPSLQWVPACKQRTVSIRSSRNCETIF